MTSKERILAALAGQPVDHIPFCPFLAYVWEHLERLEHPELLTDSVRRLHRRRNRPVVQHPVGLRQALHATRLRPPRRTGRQDEGAWRPRRGEHLRATYREYQHSWSPAGPRLNGGNYRWD